MTYFVCYQAGAHVGDPGMYVVAEFSVASEAREYIASQEDAPELYEIATISGGYAHAVETGVEAVNAYKSAREQIKSL